MGVIKRQSVKFTIINLMGTFIGFLSVIFIYPLDKELYGYFQSIYSNAYLLTPVLGLGIQAAVIRYYPVFRSKNQESTFLGFTLTLLLITILTSTLILGLVYWMFKPFFYEWFDNFGFITNNIESIYLLGILLLLSLFLMAHATVKMRIVIPEMIYALLLKIFLPVLIWLTFLKVWPEEWFTSSILIYFVCIAAAIWIYMMSLKVTFQRPQFSSLNRSEYIGLLGFMGFSFLNGLGASVALKLDISMISTMISVEAVQVYAIIMTISNIMDIPARALNQIASPVISDSWNSGAHENIQMVYQKSSVYGFIIGTLLFLILFFCWPDILRLMPRKPASLDIVLTVFLFLSIARLTDLITGVNSVIIIYSQKYKYHMYLLVFLAIINMLLNYVFISRMGITGAAVATGISYFLFNVSKYIFVKRAFRFYISWVDHIKILTWVLITFGFMYVLSFPWSPVVNIMVKNVFIIVLLGGGLWVLNPLGELRNTVKEFIHKIKIF